MTVKIRPADRDDVEAMGIEIRDPDRPAGTLSGGERQSVAIARAVPFGARLLISTTSWPTSISATPPRRPAVTGSLGVTVVGFGSVDR